MVRKMLRKRITRMKKIKLIKISQERNLFKLKRKEIIMNRKKINKTRIKLIKINSLHSNKSNKIHHHKSHHLSNPPQLM